MSKKDLNKQIALLQQQSKDLEKIEAEITEKKAKEEEVRRKEEEANRKPYKIFDTEITELDPNIVEFHKNRFRMMVVQYKLVGKFEDDGTYTIPNEIKYELIDMKKEIEEMSDDYYKVSALYMKKYFNFIINLTMLDDGKAKASLSLVEYIGKNIEEEFLYTHIADFVDVFDAEYRIKLRKAFNLVDADAINNDFDIPNLAVLMQDLFDIDFYVGGLYDMASQIYVMRMLKLLENGGEVEKEVLEKYKQLVEELESEESTLDNEENKKLGKQKNKYKNETLKELLDKAIDSVGGFEKLSVDKKQRDDIIKDLNKTESLIEKVSKGGIVEVNLPDQKDEKSTSSPSSSNGKKKSKKNSGEKSSKPGKKDKKGKKDDKKDEKPKGGGGVPVDDKTKSNYSNEKDEDEDEEDQETNKKSNNTPSNINDKTKEKPKGQENPKFLKERANTLTDLIQEENEKELPGTVTENNNITSDDIDLKDLLPPKNTETTNDFQNLLGTVNNETPEVQTSDLQDTKSQENADDLQSLMNEM